MPRAQPTQSAAREALQRRASHRRAVRCSGMFGGFAPMVPQAVFASSVLWPDERSGVAGANALRRRELYERRAVGHASHRRKCCCSPLVAQASRLSRQTSARSFLRGTSTQPRFSVRRLRRRLTRTIHEYESRCCSCSLSRGFQVRRTALTLSCAARGHVPKPERRGGCRE
jgi:hypothetical protein